MNPWNPRNPRDLRNPIDSMHPRNPRNQRKQDREQETAQHTQRKMIDIAATSSLLYLAVFPFVSLIRILFLVRPWLWSFWVVPFPPFSPSHYYFFAFSRLYIHMFFFFSPSAFDSDNNNSLFKRLFFLLPSLSLSDYLGVPAKKPVPLPRNTPE